MTEEQVPCNTGRSDTIAVKQIGDLRFCFSKQEHMLYVETCTGREALSRADIIDLLRIIDGKAGEKEQEIIADLENDEDDF